MAAVPVTFQGVLFFSDVGVGGGPMPGGPGGPGGQPPRPWGPIFYPDQGLPGNQPYPDQGLPGQPPRMWGPIYYPDQGLPGQQPPRPPLGFWGGGGVGDYIDAGFPGPQPGQPPRPWGPINYPDQGLPGGQGRPTHPIFYPPPDYQNPPEGGKPPPPEGGWGYSPEYGWSFYPPENVAKPKKPADQPQAAQQAKK